MSAKVIEDSNDSLWAGEDSSSAKRGLLFFMMAVLLSGVGMALWWSAAWYFFEETMTNKFPGTALLAGSAGIAFSYG